MKTVREANEYNNKRLHEFMNNLGHWGRYMDFTYEDGDGLVLWSDPPEHKVHAFNMDELREYIPDLIDVKEIEIRECLGIDDSDWDEATIEDTDVCIETVTIRTWECPNCGVGNDDDGEGKWVMCSNCDHIYEASR